MEESIPPAVYPNLVFNMDGADVEEPEEELPKPKRKKAPAKAPAQKKPKKTPEPVPADDSKPAEPPEPPSKDSEKVVVIKKARKGKDPAAILQKYRTRVTQTMSPADFEELRDAWISDYGITPETHHGTTLMEVCKEKGITVKGLVAENKKGGVYVQPLPDGTKRLEEGGTSKVVYVGKANRFTDKEASKWCITAEDER